MHGFELDIWVCFFVLSKLAEFGDTVLKILLQKPFIFLHWYGPLLFKERRRPLFLAAVLDRCGAYACATGTTMP